MSERSESIASDSKDAAREALAERLNALENHGITFDYLAKKLKKELNAKVSKTQKVKGSPNDLPSGYRCITTTGIIEYIKGEDDPDGPTREYSDGDSLLQWDETAWDVRQKARQDAHKLRGDYPAERKEHTGLNGNPIQEHITVEFVEAKHD